MTTTFRMPTPAEQAQIDAAVARLTAERAVPPRVLYCEVHDGTSTGACTEQCVLTDQMMNDTGYVETRVYSDYLGGTSSIDVSGCHSSPPMPWTETYLAAAPDCGTGYLVERVVHPKGECYCGTPECPSQIEVDADAEVMGRA